MKFLPNPGWPDALYKLVTKQSKARRAKYSVTELIQSPQMLQLKRRHADEMTVDPADMLWRLFGSLIHGKLEKVGGLNALTEEGLIYDCKGVTISGQPDLYENETLWDYKTTSVYAVKEGVKPEWEQQTNIYAEMLRSYGFPVKSIRIVAILRDWSATAAKREDGYPQSQVKVMKVAVWPSSECKRFIAERVTLHEAAESLPDAKLPECTDEERWASPTKYAVMKDGNKRAVKLHDTQDAADAHAKELGSNHRVELRPGEYRRCVDYCECRPFCLQAGGGSVEDKLDKAGL